jgi:hypothetical protein
MLHKVELVLPNFMAIVRKELTSIIVLSLTKKCKKKGEELLSEPSLRYRKLISFIN